MLFIFRKLRKSFFLPGKARTYLAYAVGEIALIMIGILLALQVSDWNQEKEEREKEAKYLGQLLVEMEGVQEELRDDSERRLICREAIESLLIQCQDRSATEQEVVAWVKSSLRFTWFFPPNAVLEDLMNSGDLRIISSDEIRYNLYTYHQEKARLRKTEDADYALLAEQLQPLVHRHIYRTNRPQSPGSVEALLESKEFENLLTRRNGLTRGQVIYTEDIFTAIEQIVQLIEKHQRAQRE